MFQILININNYFKPLKNGLAKKATDHKIFITILLLSFLLRMAFRSHYADDWDSVQFLLGIKNYSIAAHQPHPPGYPVYIFIGRIFNYFINNDIKAFTFLSALCGTLSLIPTYLLGQKFLGRHVGILGALLISLSPAHLLASEVVMSDIVSMLFVTTTVYLLYLGFESKQFYYIGAFMVGLSVGIRQTDILLLVTFLIVSMYRRQIKDFAISTAILSIAFASWFVPLTIYTGFNYFFNIYRTYSNGALNDATINRLGGLSLYNLLITFKSLISLFIEGWTSAFLLFILIMIVSIYYRRSHCSIYNLDKRVVLLIAWIAPYFLLFLSSYYLYYPRYLLPVFPPLAIIFAYSMVNLVGRAKKENLKKILLLIYMLSIFYMGSQAITLAYALHTIEPAPVAAAEFIREHYDPNTTIIISYDSFRHFQYYLPNYTIIWYGLQEPIVPYSYLLENKTIISEGGPVIDSNYKLYEFSRDHKIWPKAEHVKLYVNQIDSRAVLYNSGWHGFENWSGNPTRWMQAEGTIMALSHENRTATLSLQALSFYRNRTLEIYSGDELAMRVAVPTSFIRVSVPIRLAKGENTVRLHVPEDCERPCDKPELNNLDPRCLSVAVQNLTVL